MKPWVGGVQVFAVEDTSVQLTWRELPSGAVTITTGRARLTLESTGEPGTAVVQGLAPGRRHAIDVATTAGSQRLSVSTLPAPPGEELFRLGTMGDLHLGAEHFGLFRHLTEPHAVDPHPLRCARSALTDLTGWGARRLVVKGDVVQANEDRSWRMAADLLASTELPWTVLPGNHDLAHGEPDGRGGAERNGVPLVDGVEAVDVPGLRIVTMNSAVDGRDIGRWAHLLDDALDAVAEADGPALVLVHHHPQPAPIPTFHPPGIDSRVARHFLGTLARANPDVIGSSGHTHRNRRRRLPVPWSEVSSTKDFPGVWAGYAIHEGGIRQVVRRVSEPDCLEWLDRTRWVAGGVWQYWTPGRLGDRCFVHRWSGRRRPARSSGDGQ